MGLLEALTQYIKDAIPGGSLNPEQPAKLSGLLDAGKKQAQYIGGLLDPNSPISKDAQNWHKRTQIGLADQLAGRQTPEAEQAYQTMMQAAGIAPVGMIAWHGSPHKFDKFDLSKIGTGEGAQAYGHGLYLAESPHVAQNYQKQLTERGGAEGQAAYMKRMYKDNALMIAKQQAELPQLTPEARKYAQDVVAKLEGGDVNMGNLYKTDIPDEAVARFLDWDKPLSQQAPEVQAALAKYDADMYHPSGGDYDPTELGQSIYTRLQAAATSKDDRIGKIPMQQILGDGRVAATNSLHELGIPGIRYLDGGSRGTGTGTSNFVAFDPEMIRILERNGQATGLQPWKPGEWK